ncbi:mucin-2-like [Dendropsophus ebraccatus]|uniref:mucin-2-like n=1 Tax=Dendropsophus ebraccatus TaxID=150705 RepID=UPI00383216BC
MEYRTSSLWLVICLALGSSKAIDVIPGRIRNHGHYVCSTWGNYHFKTFDGGFYQFPGNCSYNLASHCRDSYQEFSVHVHRSLVNGHPLIDKITVTIKDVIVQMKSNLVMLNENIIKTPYYSFGILIYKNDAYVKMYTKAGLTLMWNKEDAVMLELDPRFNNHTCGLCGDYNGDPINSEFFFEDKTLSPINFGNQQNVNDPNEVCKDTEETEAINPANCSKYRSVCEEHLNHAAFSDCMRFLNLEPYIKACMIDMCSCDQSQDSFCLCSTITEYSRQCSHAGGRPRNWRSPIFCPKQCPGNMVYQESASPCKNSCSHLEIHSLCEEHYMDGCFCPEGTVHDDHSDRGCVPVADCHCKHQGKLYAPGESIENDCDRCRCVAGRWNCKDLPCPKVCSIEGGAHITTFDGKSYTFHGNCYYQLLEARCSLENQTNLIVGKLGSCSSSEGETCLEYVTLFTDNRKSVVMFKADGKVYLNGLKVTLPQFTANFSVLKPSKHYIIVQTIHGLQMQIQLLPKMQLYITLERTARKELQGLCGNFNTKEGDDFTTSAGLVEATASAFANSWKALSFCHDISDRLDDPCSVSIEKKNYADYWCAKLEKDESVFAKCHYTVDPTEYVKRCRYDSCNCKESEQCMCAALSSYVRACAAKGVILWGWKKGICDKYITSCPSSQIYLYNMTTCQLTCRSLAKGEQACASVFTPVDGCGCPDGQYLNEKDRCVPISKCSCYYHDTYLRPQESITTKDKHCICQNGNLVCTNQVNKPCPEGKVYFDCNKNQSLLSGTPIRRSCRTLSVEYFQTECISGCVCPNGLLDDGAGGCVLEGRCPCVHNKDIYPHGNQIKVDCNTCLCQRGKWTCTDTVCHGTCTIYGNGHYITFDNKIYDFDGNCEFVAAQDYCATDSSGGSFSVLTENIPCGTTGVTCSKSVKVFLGSTMLKLSEKHVVKTVGEGGKNIDYLTREVGIYLVIEASNGILLIWDKRTTIFIKVSPAYKGKLCGLCGNFDDNAQNDFKTRHMIQVIDVLEFGNSWKVDATCPDATDLVNPCSQNPHRHSWAEKQCGLIKSQAFKICHSKVDPKPFYEACVNDACSCDSGGDCECFCTAVAAYAQECTKAEACVYWRTPDICRCYPTCPKNKPIFHEAKKKCVTRDECGCFVNDVHYKSGEEVPYYKECYKCVCSSNGNIRCEQLDISSCSITSPITTTSATPPAISSTAATEAHSCTPICSWSQWISVSYPSDKSGGDYETYDNIRKAGYKICETPLNISCRAKHWPNSTLDDLRQKVTCDVSYGLICNIKDQDIPPFCNDYEIRVYCCSVPDMCLHTTPQSTLDITSTSHAATNTFAKWISTRTTKFSETSSQTSRSTPISASTHAITSPTPTFVIHTQKGWTTSPRILPQDHANTSTTAATIRSTGTQTVYTRPESTPPSTIEPLLTSIKASPATTITFPPSKSMTSTKEVISPTRTFLHTTSNIHTTTTTRSTTSTTATSKTADTSISSQSIPTSATQVFTLISNIPPTIITTSTSITKPESTTASTIFSKTTKTVVTDPESIPAFTAVTTNSKTTIFPTTNKTTKIYTTRDPLETSPTKSTLSFTPKGILTTSHMSHESATYTHITPTSEANSLLSTSPTPTPTSEVTTEQISPTSSTHQANTASVTASNSNRITPLTYLPTKTIPTLTSKLTSRWTTEATSIVSSQTTTSGSMSRMPSTLRLHTTRDVTTKSSIPSFTELTPSSITTTSRGKTAMPETSPAAHTLSKTSTSTSVLTSRVTTNGKETSILVCVCTYNGIAYPRGEVISKVTNGTWCHKVKCNMECKIEVEKLLCTSTPASTPAPALKSTSNIFPTLNSTSPQVNSRSTRHRPEPGCLFEKFRKPNETWMLDNCTMARCLETHTVEIIERKCEPPPVITCANGYPPVVVPDDDKCCWHWECDCLCSGWGDPHYKTFDGTYYTFQGICTYTLVEEIEKKNNFAIYIDNYDCGTNDSVSCPQKLIVRHNTQEIQLFVRGLEDTNVQVSVNGETVGVPYKKYGVKIYTLGVYYVVEIPELGTNITYNGLAFSIKLPFHHFGHNTQGQCGTCTNNQSDDCRTRDGNIVSKCEIMADSWIIDDSKKPNCGHIMTTGTPSPTCQPSSLCSLILGPTFQKCHKIVSPNDYYESCLYDTCHVSRPKIECSSLQHYAQLCRDQGICIDWRSQVPECSMLCPSHKVYNACGPAIPKTCETIPEEHSIMKDDEHLVEGCFCPQGSIYFSPAVDICVQNCGCVGPDNVPRKFGEKFQLGCQDCICIEGGSGITCQKHRCKEMTEVQCSLEGFYPEVQISLTDPCCKETVCNTVLLPSIGCTLLNRV